MLSSRHSLLYIYHSRIVWLLLLVIAFPHVHFVGSGPSQLYRAVILMKRYYFRRSRYNCPQCSHKEACSCVNGGELQTRGGICARVLYGCEFSVHNYNELHLNCVASCHLARSLRIALRNEPENLLGLRFGSKESDHTNGPSAQRAYTAWHCFRNSIVTAQLPGVYSM